ncbi:MAG: Trigger factor [Patescibacteria group bacterium]|nr:trigger factor [Candidatus Saccharibacteria bacterium]MDQ5963126.1 Trigger factor [Patescibacteria group bacterium]
MQITKKSLSPTKLELTLVADTEMLETAKKTVLTRLGKDVSLAGFRKGHAPAAMVEKNVDQNLLGQQVIDTVVNELFLAAVTQEKIRVVGQPSLELTKFVPFTDLEAKATVDVVGEITLPDYKKFRVKVEQQKTTKDDVQAVLDDLQARDAERKEVKRAAKDGDEVVINFVGKDAKTGDAIEGGKGDKYPLVLGSNTFIPGFEPELVGLKKGDEKTFTVTFPKDYGAKDLQNKKVSFEVEVQEVREVAKPKADDTWASKLGSFKTLDELKADIERQIQSEKDSQSMRSAETELLATLADKSKVEIPAALVEDEMGRMETEEKQNLMYRGVTWQEHLEAAGKNEDEYRKATYQDEATRRVKTGLCLGEVADKEGVTVSEAELNARMELLKAQYTDSQMQEELKKPEVRRDISSRVLTEKTIQKLVEYATR